MRMKVDLRDVPGHIQRRLADDVAGQSVGPAAHAVYRALADGIRIAWQTGEEASVYLPLTNTSVEELKELNLSCLALRDAFAPGPWPQIAELFNEVIMGIRQERMLRRLGQQQRERVRVFGDEAADALADDEWTPDVVE